MAPVAYVKPERISLKDHPELNERWLQERIGEDPSLLGLGDLILNEKNGYSRVRDVWTCSFKMRSRRNGMRSRFN